MKKSFDLMREEYCEERCRKKRKRILFIGVFALIIAIIAYMNVPTFTPIQYINASNITNYSIIWASGNLSDASDIDNRYILFNETASPWHIDINFTNISHFSYIELKAVYFSLLGTPSQHEVEFEIWCEAEQDMVDVTEMVISPDETYFTRRFPDSMHFIRPDGNVTLRLNHTSNGNTNHRFKLNTIRLINQSQFSQISINQTIVSGGGAGCTGNCSFNNLSVNSLGKNNTLDSYSVYIHLVSPIKTIYTDISSFIDTRLGNIFLEVVNTTTANASSILLTSEYISMRSGDGTGMEMLVKSDNITFIDSLGNNMIYNGTDLNLGGANLTNCTNCNSNLNLKVNKSGDIMTGQLDIIGLLNQTSFNDSQQPLLKTFYNSSYTHNLNEPCTDFGGGNCPLILHEMGSNLTNVTVKHRFNAVNNGYGILVNANITNVTTLQDPSKTGWGFFARPNNDDFYVGRFTPGLSEFTIRVISNTSFTVYQQNTTINSLAVSGSGNWSIVMADSTGRLQAFPMNGTGNHYGCFDVNGRPFPGTPGC